MKSLFILSNAKCYGGAEKSLETILPELVKKFYITICIENDMHYDSVKSMKLNNIRIIKLRKGKNIISTIVNILKIRHMLMLEKTESFYLTNTRNGAIYLALISLLYHINFDNAIIYVRDFLWKYKAIVFPLINKAKFAVPTEALINNDAYLLKYLNREQIYVTMNAMEVSCKFEKNNCCKYIVNLANFSKWKGQIYLIKAFEKAEVSKLGFVLRIYGTIHEDDCYRNIIKYINTHDLNNSVEIYPFSNSTDEIYKNAAFVVISSISNFGGPETFGRTVIESWSYGKTVIAFDVGGPAYIIDNNINGILVPEKNVDLLAKAIRKLAIDKQLRHGLAENGYEKVNTEFRPIDIANRLYEIWNV